MDEVFVEIAEVVTDGQSMMLGNAPTTPWRSEPFTARRLPEATMHISSQR